MRLYVAFDKGFENSAMTVYVGPSLERAANEGKWFEVWENGEMVDSGDWTDEEHDMPMRVRAAARKEI